jgi:DNA-directed RNA polymerase subunit N (RpoN/RPB10)
MLIPPRCFTCGTPIGDKWGYFVDTMIEKKNASKEQKDSQLDIEYIDIKDDGSIKKSIEGEILDELELHKYCCRRMFLGNVQLINYI